MSSRRSHSDRRRFVDTATIHVRAGHGGRGSASFRREPFTPRGGPDGGDGGRGGSILLEATTGVSDLSLYRQRRRWNAEPGANGAGGRKTGKNGADVTLSVPVGTIALAEDGTVIADLDVTGARAEVARGGLGGRGNVHFKSSRRQAPDYAEPGIKGEELDLTLDLKLIADVGLVGPPNAGKSSLLAALTAARPKVADYPFTTLDPELGVAQTEAGRIILADIPGLIEGAAEGAGLGQTFLRHVERTRVLVYVLDGSSPDPWHDLETVRHEVVQFSPALASRPSVVAVNKVDLDATRRLRARTRRKGVLWVSALTRAGLPELMSEVARLLAVAPAPVVASPTAVTRLPEQRRAPAIAVERRPFGYVVTGDRVDRLLERADLESDGGLARFQVALDRLGVDEALARAGAQAGDTVRLGELEFEFQP